MADLNVAIPRVSHSSRLSVRVLQSGSRSGRWANLCSYQGHMRVALPPTNSASEALTGKHNTSTKPLGWKTLLEFPSPRVSIDHRVMRRCPHCQEPGLRFPLGVEGTLVGRSMLLPDDELNRFKVEKPWGRLVAVEQGPDAVQSWEYEDSSPPLDLMPVLTPPRLRLN